MTTSSATQSKRSVDDPQTFDHCFANVNGIRMHYVQEGQGPLVVLLHGYATTRIQLWSTRRPVLPIGVTA